MDLRVKKFIQRKTLPENMEINQVLHDTINLLEKSNEIVQNLVEKNIDELAPQVAWTTMHKMYKRNYEYCCGAISCFLITQIQSSEVLCRTAVEASVNLHYISIDDSVGKQIAYFKNYFFTERKQNKNWKNSVKNSEITQPNKDGHYGLIDEKELALNWQEYALQESLKLEGVNFNESSLKWPNIFERFSKINDEIGYRTVYAALCSQAHSDAEDIINEIFSEVMPSEDIQAKHLYMQQYIFTQYMNLLALHYHIRASVMYLSKFNIDVTTLLEVYEEVNDNVILVAENKERLILEGFSKFKQHFKSFDS